MLIGIDALLGGDLLKLLDDMGHGDQLMVVNRNYPAAASDSRLVRVASDDIERVLRAIWVVFSLDGFVSHPMERMVVDDDETVVTECQSTVLELARGGVKARVIAQSGSCWSRG